SALAMEIENANAEEQNISKIAANTLKKEKLNYKQEEKTALVLSMKKDACTVLSNIVQQEEKDEFFVALPKVGS
ncbi:hypothetical protein HHI36_009216, partial [Cryptolaemus montrouzieri]